MIQAQAVLHFVVSVAGLQQRVIQNRTWFRMQAHALKKGLGASSGMQS
jgi:hypothetical protein